MRSNIIHAQLVNLLYGKRGQQPDILSCEKCENDCEGLVKEVVVYGEEKDNLASVGLKTRPVVHASVGAINPRVDTRRC